MYDVAIIGCGVVGAAAAYRLARCRLRVLVLEAGNDVANATTKANSAILHAGYDPEPGTRMAALNVEGNRMALDICRRLDVPVRQTGSLVLAFAPEQLPHLQTLYERGLANGVPGLELLSGEAARALEPGLSAPGLRRAARPHRRGGGPLGLCPCHDRDGGAKRRRAAPQRPPSPPSGRCRAAALPLPPRRGRCRPALWSTPPAWTPTGCTPLLEPVTWRTQPSRGEYYLLDKTEGGRVGRVIFQCPGPEGKGVLVAPTVHGNLIVGPNAEPVTDRRDLGNTADGLAFVKAPRPAERCPASALARISAISAASAPTPTGTILSSNGAGHTPASLTWRASSPPA